MQEVLAGINLPEVPEDLSHAADSFNEMGRTILQIAAQIHSILCGKAPGIIVKELHVYHEGFSKSASEEDVGATARSVKEAGLKRHVAGLNAVSTDLGIGRRPELNPVKTSEVPLFGP